MPEPKKPKRTFEAQAQSNIQGMQILPNASRTSVCRKDNSPTDQPERTAGPAESSLVEKLIDFIKAMD